MNIKFDVDVSEVLLQLRNTEDLVHRNARKTMHRAADRIVARARRMAPVMTGNLEASIQKVIDYEDDTRRLMIDIVLEDSEEYMVIMHEAEYELGPLSQAKQDGQTELVGNRFLERAAEVEEDKLADKMIEAIKEAF